MLVQFVGISIRYSYDCMGGGCISVSPRIDFPNSCTMGVRTGRTRILCTRFMQFGIYYTTNTMPLRPFCLAQTFTHNTRVTPPPESSSGPRSLHNRGNRARQPPASRRCHRGLPEESLKFRFVHLVNTVNSRGLTILIVVSFDPYPSARRKGELGTFNWTIT